MSTIAYTEDRELRVPENKITEILKGHTYEALRGSAHTLAVFEGSKCVGWILKETLAGE